MSELRTEHGHLVGHRFEGGPVSVPHWENWLFCDAVLAGHPAHRDPAAAAALGYPAPVVHPGLVYYMCVRGARLTFAGLFALFDFDMDDGPMFGGQSLTFTEPVFEDREYVAEGEITSVERKAGRRAGVFDMISFQVRLTREGRTIVTSSNSFVLPRRHLDRGAGQ